MNSKPFRLFAMMLGLVGFAQASVIWNLDTTSGFDVTFGGSGLALGNGDYLFGPSNPIVSPLGLWQISSGENACYHSADAANEAEWEIMGGSQVSYLSTTLPSDYPDYAGPAILQSDSYDNFSPGNDPDPHNGNKSDMFGLAFFGWQGQSTIAITIPNPNDISTWSWTAHYWASGSDLSVNVPDAGETISMLGGAIITLLWLRRRSSMKGSLSLNSNID